MLALSAVVFALSWWLGLYLLARDPRKLVLVLAAVGLSSFALVVALDAVRVITGSEALSRVEIYLVAVPGIAWFAVLLELHVPVTPGVAEPVTADWSPVWPRLRSWARRWQVTSRGHCAGGTG